MHATIHIQCFIQVSPKKDEHGLECTFPEAFNFKGKNCKCHFLEIELFQVFMISYRKKMHLKNTNPNIEWNLFIFAHKN